MSGRRFIPPRCVAAPITNTYQTGNELTTKPCRATAGSHRKPTCNGPVFGPFSPYTFFSPVSSFNDIRHISNLAQTMALKGHLRLLTMDGDQTLYVLGWCQLPVAHAEHLDGDLIDSHMATYHFLTAQLRRRQGL